MGRYAVVSDIHGNLFALDSVMNDISGNEVDSIIILGDLIDYGMQSNEVVERIRSIPRESVFLKIWGNHEHAIIKKDYTRFSSKRGVESAKFTRSTLSESSIDYLENDWEKEGCLEFELGGLKCLAIHGSLEDPFWKSIEPDNLRGDYSTYDVVFSGHSHFSHCFTHFYKADNPDKRNKKSVIFINPGSVGQPRNHNPHAQYVIFDDITRSVDMRAIPYNIEGAMRLYTGQVDDFYRVRLKNGI